MTETPDVEVTVKPPKPVVFVASWLEPAKIDPGDEPNEKPPLTILDDVPKTDPVDTDLELVVVILIELANGEMLLENPPTLGVVDVMGAVEAVVIANLDMLCLSPPAETSATAPSFDPRLAMLLLEEANTPSVLEELEEALELLKPVLIEEDAVELSEQTNGEAVTIGAPEPKLVKRLFVDEIGSLTGTILVS